MPRGLNTEVEERLLGQFQYPEFSQVTVAGGVTRPRGSDASYTPAGSSLDEWMGARLGADDFTRVYSIEAEQEYYAFCDKDGGKLQMYDPIGLSTFDALPGEVAEKPVFGGWESTLAKDGLLWGTSGIYAMAWTKDGHFVYGLSDTLTVKQDAVRLTITVDTGTAPADGVTITNTAKSNATAKKRGSTGAGAYWFISKSERSTATTWQNTDTLTWSGGTGHLDADEADVDTDLYDGWIRPYFLAPASPPAGVTHYMMFRLEDSTGYYRALWKKSAFGTVWAVAETSRDAVFFPYMHDTGDTFDSPGPLLPLYPGPYDKDFVPETTLYSMDSAQAVAWHKNCLFVASGNIIRASEPEKPCYFREAFSLDAGDTVLKMVSRDELLEVYTPTAVKYVIGAAPFFELRETGISEGPVSKDSIVRTDVGTFALFDDGLYLISGSTRRNLTAGNNTPWVYALTTPGSAVGGASQGIFYLCATDGTVLAYDWEQDEWFNRTFTAQPVGFFYSDTRRALVAKVSSALLEVGSGVAAVTWSLAYPTQGDYRSQPIPGFASIDCDGAMVLKVYVEDDLVRSLAVSGSEDVPLPVERGRFYQLKLSGSGTKANTSIRSMRAR
jgi:hypothetical protein